MYMLNKLNRKFLESADDDGDASGGTGGKDEGKKAVAGVDPAQFAALVNTVGTLATGLQSLQQSVSDLTERDNADPPRDEDVMDADLEQMDRNQFAKHIVGGVLETINKKFDEIDNKIKDVDSKGTATSVQAAVDKMRGEHKDFDDFLPEIRELVKETPGLSLQRAYALAKSENPEKVEELREKYKEDDEPKESKKGFGGLTPTSNATVKTSDMSKENAAQAAWDEVMADIDFAGLAEES